jgi:microcystin-dependent protein
LGWAAGGSISMNRLTTAGWTQNIASTSTTAVPTQGASGTVQYALGLGGTTDANSNMPPYLSVNYIIRAS